MNKPELGKEIIRLLDRGLDDIDPSTLQRLQAARRASLENYQMAETIGTTGSSTFVRNGHDWHFNARKTLSLAALLFVLAVAAYWQNPLQQVDEIADLDIMVLTDELPVNAYLDNEFDEWLDNSWQ